MIKILAALGWLIIIVVAWIFSRGAVDGFRNAARRRQRK